MSGRAGACAHAIFDSQGSRRTTEHGQLVPIRSDPSRGTSSGRHGPHASSRYDSLEPASPSHQQTPTSLAKRSSSSQSSRVVTERQWWHCAAQGNHGTGTGTGAGSRPCLPPPGPWGPGQGASKSRSRSPGLSPVSIGPGASNLLEQFLIKGICLCQRCLTVGASPYVATFSTMGLREPTKIGTSLGSGQRSGLLCVALPSARPLPPSHGVADGDGQWEKGRVRRRRKGQSAGWARTFSCSTTALCVCSNLPPTSLFCSTETVFSVCGRRLVVFVSPFSRISPPLTLRFCDRDVPTSVPPLYSHVFGLLPHPSCWDAQYQADSLDISWSASCSEETQTQGLVP